MAKVSQSRTMWVPKGTIVNGKKVAKGYVAQYGKPGRKVSATVQLTGGGTRTYKKGRAVPTQAGGGQTSKSKSAPVKTKSTTPTTKPNKPAQRTVSKSALEKGAQMPKKPPTTFAATKGKMSMGQGGQSTRRPRALYPVDVAYNIGENVGMAGRNIGRTGANTARKTVRKLPKILENIWYM